jgi:hypothetical protein
LLAGELDVFQPLQSCGFPDQRRSHLGRGRRRLWIHAAGMRDAYHQVEVAHRLRENHSRYRLKGLR